MRSAFLSFALIICSLNLFSQQKNQLIFDQMANQTILYGQGTPDIFSNEPFSLWYAEEYTQYKVTEGSIQAIKPLLTGVTFRVVIGTWCKDSKREVPRFMKIINMLEFPLDKLEIIGVDRKKLCPEAGVVQGSVNFVPTFFISRNGKEIGQIIEQPQKTLEEDLLRILSQN